MFCSKVSNPSTIISKTTQSVPNAPVVKKEQLTKSQKRRQWDHRMGGDDGQKPRGYDWIDIIRHLSQTGHKNED